MNDIKMNHTPIKTDGYCIDKLIQSLKRKIGIEAAEQLKETAIKIVQNCVDVYGEKFGYGDVGENGTGIVSHPHEGKIPDDTTGLMYGRIQSGKTNTTIATLAIASENKFRCFIVLTSNNTWLGKQTASRFNNQLSQWNGLVIFNWEDWRKNPDDFAKGEKEQGWDNQPLYLPTLIIPKTKFIFMFNYSEGSDEPENILENGIYWEDTEEIKENEWLYATAHNPAFDFLNNPEEDIYTLADGKPFHD